MEIIGRLGQIRANAPACFLGRQPIYDGNREIRAYELLYRRNVSDPAACFSSGDQASAEVLLRAFLEIGLPTVSPEQPVFVNHTTALLAMNPILPPDRCVVEVLEDVAVGPKTVACLERLKGLGYLIALDDFVYSDAHVPFLYLADYVKLDLRALPTDEFCRHVKFLRPFGVKIIAEKVESAAEFETAKALGCDLFQGYYLRKPEVLTGRRIPANRLSALSLLAECIDPEQSASAIAGILARDATLVYGVLRLANSALYACNARIESPVQAVSMLGMDRVFKWASLLVLAGYDNCPLGYLGLAIQRGRACEIVAEAYGCPLRLAYLAGLLSALDSILMAPLSEILMPLPLEPEFKRAVLQREGDLGTILETVLSFEAGHWDAAELHGLSIPVVQSAFWHGVKYSASMLADLKPLITNPRIRPFSAIT